MKHIRMAALTALCLFLTPACDFITDPEPLEDFVWEAVEDVDEVVEGIDAAAFFGEIALLGQLKTPTLCYTLDPAFSQSGSTLTLEVDAKSNNAPNCARTTGGFRYTAAIRHLKRGNYTLKVIHRVSGTSPQEYTVSLTL